MWSKYSQRCVAQIGAPLSAVVVVVVLSELS